MTAVEGERTGAPTKDPNPTSPAGSEPDTAPGSTTAPASDGAVATADGAPATPTEPGGAAATADATPATRTEPGATADTASDTGPTPVAAPPTASAGGSTAGIGTGAGAPSASAPQSPLGTAPTSPPAAPSRAVPPPSGAAAAPRRVGRRRRLPWALAAGLVGALIAVAGGLVGAALVLLLRPTPPPPPPAPAASTDLADAVAAVTPAVWRIQAGDPVNGTAGTAVVLTPTGDVVTNDHLVNGEKTATLIAADGRRVEARVVGTDPKADLAWLRIDGVTDLPTARLARPTVVRPGEDVVAIGNALNLDGPPSITRGVVSAVGRSTATLEGVIQTDAAISSGSSGGALVDRSGAVVGVTTEALVGDPSVSVEDIAFAIPTDRVIAVLGGMGLVLPPA